MTLKSNFGEVRALARKVYQETIEQEQDTELKRALKTHERVPVFIDNLAREFGLLTYDVRRETIEGAVRDMTRWFVHCVKTQAGERIMSEISKIQIRARKQAAEEFRKEAEELEARGTTHVTQDKKGNETHTTVIEI